MRLLITAFALAIPLVAEAQVVCGPGQQACGSQCYTPASGLHCIQGNVVSTPYGTAPMPVVCGPGQQLCGDQCFNPASGQQCFPGGVVCGPGQQPCGTQCYSPATGQTCRP